FAPGLRSHSNPTEIYAAGIMFSDRGYGNRSNRHVLAHVSTPVEVLGVCGAAAVFRREVLRDIGVFNEGFAFLCEDLELSLRHVLRRKRCLYVPRAVAYHTGSATLGRFPNMAVEE